MPLIQVAERAWLELPVGVGGDGVHKHAAPLVRVHDVAARQVLLQPGQHGVAQLLVRVCLHDLRAGAAPSACALRSAARSGSRVGARLWLEVRGLQACEGHMVRRVAVDARALLALVGALGHAQECDVDVGRAAERLHATWPSQWRLSAQAASLILHTQGRCSLAEPTDSEDCCPADGEHACASRW